MTFSVKSQAIFQMICNNFVVVLVSVTLSFYFLKIKTQYTELLLLSLLFIAHKDYKEYGLPVPYL